MKISNHVTTLKVTDENFQKIDISTLPKGWEYNQTTHDGGTQHIFKRKWKLDFEKEVLPSLVKDKVKLYDLAKDSWVIKDQARQKIALANMLGIVGDSKESKVMQRSAERLVAKGFAKTIKEALEMVS